jgi:hypothetical protein
MKSHDAGTAEFTQQFSDFPHHRQKIIASFIVDNNRLLLNIPRYGPARQISARLREGPFSDLYEFEKGLARALHPVMAGLNLNFIADILINRHFTEKYQTYSRDINYILASNKKLEPDALKNVIIKMAEKDGHYMVVKFYDLVLRLIDANLHKKLKPAELCVIEMKKTLVGSAAEKTPAIRKIYNTYRKTYGGAEARLLFNRVQWDRELKNYLQIEEEPDYMEITGDAPEGFSSEYETDFVSGEKGSVPGPGPDDAAGETADADPWEDRVARYASLIKENYLIRKEPSDEQGIRSIIEGMAVKNERVSGPERAADIVQDVLALWVEDDALDQGMRVILSNIRDERQGMPAPQEEAAPNEPAQDETEPDETAQDGIAPDEAAQDQAVQVENEQESFLREESGPTADEGDEAGTGEIDEEKAIETARAEEESGPQEDGVSDEELSAILNGIPDETPEHDEPSAAVAGQEALEQGDDETFLISEDDISKPAGGNPQPESGADDSFLIGEEETADEIPDELPGKASAEQDFIEDMIAADEFVIQDELLYEDKSLKKRKKKTEKKPDDA